MNDTICAIATAQGVGAIAIIRVSGEESTTIVNKIFKGKDLTQVSSHTINYGHIINEDGTYNIEKNASYEKIIDNLDLKLNPTNTVKKMVGSTAKLSPFEIASYCFVFS